jgi:N-acetylglucosamine-6-phosphate deacetylase
MRRTGTTRFLLTVVTAALPAMEAALRAVAGARQTDRALAHAIPGIHLEGPFLAPEDGPRGAHPAAWVRDPDWDVFRRLQEAAGGLIRLVTLAPERPGAEALIRRLCQAGVIVAIGHTNAGEADIDRAAEAGARLSTHLGNGAHAVLPRHRNYIQKQLATDGLAASLICDGHHLPSYVVQNILRCKGPDRVILVTDAMAAAAAAPGNYRLGEVLAEVGPDGYVRLPGTPYLAGSALTMERAVDNCARFAGVPLEQAVAMASRRPRELLGEPVPGIATGAPADLLVLRPGPPLAVVATIVQGEVAFDAECGMPDAG